MSNRQAQTEASDRKRWDRPAVRKLEVSDAEGGGMVMTSDGSSMNSS